MRKHTAFNINMQMYVIQEITFYVKHFLKLHEVYFFAVKFLKIYTLVIFFSIDFTSFQ